jgi:DNA-binding GntR family transcriptional regulator
MAPDPVTQARIYEAIKDDFLAGKMRPGVRLEIQAIAERHRTSTTPVREVLHRLEGERLVEPRPEGGFRIAIPELERLRHLYAWNRQALLSALHMADARAIRDAFRPLAARPARRDPIDIVDYTAAIFQAIGAAAGNLECADHIRNLSERLHYPRIAEMRIFVDADGEIAAMTRNGHIEVRGSLARRIDKYHRKRIEFSNQILQIAAMTL